MSHDAVIFNVNRDVSTAYNAKSFSGDEENLFGWESLTRFPKKQRRVELCYNRLQKIEGIGQLWEDCRDELQITLAEDILKVSMQTWKNLKKDNAFEIFKRHHLREYS